MHGKSIEVFIPFTQFLFYINFWCTCVCLNVTVCTHAPITILCLPTLNNRAVKYFFFRHRGRNSKSVWMFIQHPSNIHPVFAWLHSSKLPVSSSILAVTILVEQYLCWYLSILFFPF